MSEHIAYCGLNCADCDAFKATQANDVERLKQIADRWNREHNRNFTEKDIECDGCLSQRISGWCQSICTIRPCAEKIGVETCAHCSKYPCESLETFLVDEPIARAKLDEIYRTL